MHIEYGVISDIGRVRTSNEDSYIVDVQNSLFLVADGMGGHAAGEVASRIAADTVQEFISGSDRTINMETLLQLAVLEANSRVYQTQQATPEYRGMGSTLTVLAFQDDRYYLAQVGDSRAYLLRDKRLSQLSRDHSVVWPLYESGVLSKDNIRKHPQKNLVTRCIGTQLEVEAVQIFAHVQSARRARQWNHPHLNREAKHDLRRSTTTLAGDSHQCRGLHFLTIRGQEGEPLVNNTARLTQSAHIPIPAGSGIAAILNERGNDTAIRQ